MSKGGIIIMDKECLKELQGKIEFAKKIGKDCSEAERIGIVKIDYQVYYKDDEDEVKEWLVITYKGGAIAVRNCRGNSNSANFREIALMINGGYYDEVKGYREFLNNEINVSGSKWKRVFYFGDDKLDAQKYWEEEVRYQIAENEDADRLLNEDEKEAMATWIAEEILFNDDELWGETNEKIQTQIKNYMREAGKDDALEA